MIQQIEFKNRTIICKNDDGTRTIFNQETGIIIEVNRFGRVIDQIYDELYKQVIKALIVQYSRQILQTHI